MLRISASLVAWCLGLVFPIGLVSILGSALRAARIPPAIAPRAS